ncbi:MAG TPA: DUF3618 domain-containing protein [Methylomirabilota bacterium]|nr:DUF3618 domain-containing protein [Methylomirabilota bacterium]
MSTHNDTKSPEEIEREVEMARADVRSTLGDIRESLSPGQMIDQALEYVRGSGGADFTRNLGRSVRDNPVPVALIGAGIGWLMLSDRCGGDGRRRPRYTADELYTDPDRHHVHVDGDDRPGIASRASGAASRMGSSVSGATHGARDRAGAMASSASEAAYAAGERVSESAASVRDRARRMSHGVGDRLSDTASAVGDYASAAGEKMRHAGEGVRHGGERLWDASAGAGRSVSRAVEDQPLILGAVGLVVGAMIGAALPGSRTENRLFGSAADRVKSTAKSMARDGLSEAGHVASDAVSEVGRTLDEHGLSGRGLRETVGAVGDTVKETIDPNRREDQASATPGASPTSPPKSGNGASEAERRAAENRH